jgi:hypothetical protein
MFRIPKFDTIYMKLFMVDSTEIRNEIEMRMNPDDFSVSSMDLIDIMNLFDITEQEVAVIYSQLVEEKQGEIRSAVEDVVDYFRASGDYYPSYQKFRQAFDDYEDYNVNDNILRDMYKQTITDKNQLSLFEIIKDELKKVMSESYSDDEFDTATNKIMKNWGGEIKKDRSAKLNPEDIFDLADAGAAARADIEGEFGEDEFLPMTDDEYKNLMKGIDEAVDEKGLFQVEDAEGNIIKRHTLVTPVNGVEKKGRVMGFGDDGQGRIQLMVTWEWPTDMKFTNPEEMGDDRVYPEDIVLASSRNMNEGEDELPGGDHPDGYSFDKTSLYKWFQDALWQLRWYDEAVAAEVMEKAFERDYDYKLKMSEMKNENINEEQLNELEFISEEEEQALEEMRGLGKGVKNSGDRNVKQRDDHHSAPLTNLDETVESNINKLFEGKVTKKQLVNFINEQAKEVAKKLKD